MMQGVQPDRAFEVFVKRTLSAIQKESWGRSKESKELREICQNVLNLLQDHEQGHLQYEGSLAIAVLEPLYLACASSNPKILDAALGCLHKLVAHAWLQGESSSSGQASDADVVSRVIRTVIHCGETISAEGMQLAVIRALLTFTTAEHFVAHGDCLLAAVRMVFNLALGAEGEVIKRTASNALLQMLNTITKRVTAAYQLYGGSSAATSRRSSLDGSLPACLVAHSHSQLAIPHSGAAATAAAAAATGPQQQLYRIPGGLAEEQQAAEAALAAAAAAAAARWVASGGSSKADAGAGAGNLPEAPPSLAEVEAEAVDSASGREENSCLPPAEGGGEAAAASAKPIPSQDDGPMAGKVRVAGAGGNRTAQLAILAEQRDLAGLEAALGPAANLDEGLDASEEEGPVVGRVRQQNPVRGSGDGGGGGGGAGSGANRTSSSSGGTSGHSAGPTFSLRTSSVPLTSHGGGGGGYMPPSPSPPLPSMQQAPSPGRGAVPPPPDLSSPNPSSSAVAAATAAATGQRSATEARGTVALDSPFLGAAAAAMAASDVVADRDGSSFPTLTSQTFHQQRHQESQQHLGQQESPASSSHTIVSAQQHHRHQHHHHHHHHHQLQPQSSGGGHRGDGPTLSRALRTSERDVLLVLTAFCRLASREGGVTDVDKYLAAGKLLALELVVKVLQNSMHCWDHVRDEFIRHLHQPLCLVLLRNCSPSDAAAFQLALKLLTVLLMQPKLRKGLKAELGAFYPLLLLRPLEEELMGAAEMAAVAAAVPCLAGLVSEPQLLVDLFVNYDCDLKAPNLYERTVQALSRLSRRKELDGPPASNTGGSGAKQLDLAFKQLSTARDTALRSLLSVVHCLDVWSAPLKEQPAGPPAEGTEKSSVTASGGRGGGRRIQHQQSQSQQQEEALAKDSESESGIGLPAAAARANGGGGGGAASAAAGAAGGASEAARFEAVKVAKSSLRRGLLMFNDGNPVKAMRWLISSGVVEGSAAGVAVFLRAHAADLDPASMGEYLGHHEDFELAAMRAYVDQERYGGMPIDTALRCFLRPFRLPGEAQKIDRLMEAFAERYVRDNPGVFRNADAAYVLAFAVIMLNTDAHNPLAERRLDRAGFVAMTSLPTEEGGGGGVYEPALPVRELEGIYDRIVAQEIVVRSTPAGAGGGGGGGAAAAASTGGKRGGGGGRGAGNKLAAALGLRALVAPFRSASAVDRKQVSNVERQRQQMMEVAELAVARGGSSRGGAAAASSSLSHTWHTCTHAAHTRPMLTVSGEALTAALVAAVPYVPEAEAVLGALVTLAGLAGLMGLEELCEAAVAAVAATASVTAPAPFGSAAAARQLTALRMLLGAAGSSEAGQLGSAWTIILRTASELEALVRIVTRPLQPGEAGMVFMSPPSSAAGGGGGAAAAAGPAATGNTATGTGGGSLLTRVFGGLWGGGIGGGSVAASGTASGGPGGSPAANNGGAPAAAGGGGGRKDCAELPPPPVRAMPGAAMTMWAVTVGRSVIEEVYTRSASLDGEAVVVFVRALCAVSREELDAARPRVYSMQRLVEVAHLNLAGRIRLIWSKLWAVLSAHLVMAACHGQQPIAAQAVDALRSLASRVLEREQLQLQRATAGAASAATAATSAAAAATQPQALTQSTWGASEGALRPFVALLRLSDDASIRAMALAAVVGAMTAHARSLGAGWRVAMEALRRAAEDGSLTVYEQALGALEVAVAALFRPAVAVQHGGNALAAAAPPGHDCYRETLRAVLTAVRNPHHPDRAPLAVQLLVRIGSRLAARPPPPPLTHQPDGSHAASSSAAASSYASQQHLRTHSLAPPPPLESAASGGANGSVTQPPLLLHRSLLDKLAVAPLHARATKPSEDWTLLMEVAAAVAASPTTPRLAAAGLEISLDLMRNHSAAWGARAWRVMLHKVMAAVAFRVPPALDPAGPPMEAAAAAAAATVGVLPLESISASFVARVDRLFPLMCSQLAPLAEAAAAAVTAAAARRADADSYGSRPFLSSDSDGNEDDDDEDSDGDDVGRRRGRGGDGVGGRQGKLYLEVLALLGATCLDWFRHPSEAVARVGLSNLARLLEVTGGVMLSSPSAAEGGGGCGRGSFAGSAPVSAWCSSKHQHQQSLHLQLQQGWNVLLPLLSPTLLSELDLITQFSERLRRQQLAAAVDAAGAPAPPLFAGAQPPLDAEARRLRCRCRMAVLLQRTLSEYTVRCSGHLPWSVTRQLIALLVDVAQRLMRFNMREDLPPELVARLEQRCRKEPLLGQEQRLSREGRQLHDDDDDATAATTVAVAAAAVSAAPAAARDGWGDGWDDDWEEGEAGPRTEDARPGEMACCGGATAECGGAGSGTLDTVGSAGEPCAVNGVKGAAQQLLTKSPSEVVGGNGGSGKDAKLSQSSAFAAIADADADAAAQDSRKAELVPVGTATASAAAAPEALASASPSQAAEAIPGEAAAAAAARSTPGTALPGARLHLSGPHLLLTSATSHDGLRPALARLEVESADAAITLLIGCATAPTVPPSDPASTAAAAQQCREACGQLDALCRHIIECSVAAHARAAAAAAASPSHAALAAAPLEPAPLDPSLPGSSWDHAVRAAVLARAIRVLLAMGSQERFDNTVEVGKTSMMGFGAKAASVVPARDGDQQTNQLTLLADVLTLLCSHQSTVRGAVADYLDAVVGPQLERVLRAATQ